MDCLRHAYHRLCGTLPAPPAPAPAPVPAAQARASVPDGLARGLQMAAQVRPLTPLAPDDFLTPAPLTANEFLTSGPLAAGGDLPALVALEELLPGRVHLDPQARRPAWAAGLVAVRHDSQGRTRRVLTPPTPAGAQADLPPVIRLQARLSAIDQRLAVLRAQGARRVQTLAAARAAAQAGTAITPAQTLQAARRVGLQLALRDGLAQLAGRTGGLALALALQAWTEDDSDRQPLLAAAGGVALVGFGLAFGARLSEMLVKAFELRRRPVLAHTALLALPLALQLGLPLAGAWRSGRASVGLQVLVNLLNRNLSALLRDGLAQALTGRLGSLQVVTPQGSRPDLQRVLEQVDPARLVRAGAWYTVFSLLLLVRGRAVFEDWVGGDGRHRFAVGMGAVLASALNEALDGYNGAIAQAEAAVDHGLALRYVAAEPFFDRRSGAPDYLGRWRNHASARYGLGILTSDVWMLGAELAAPGSSARAGFRIAAAVANGATTLRGYLVERSHRADRLAAEREETWIERFSRASAQAQREGLYGDIRAALVADVRRDWLGAAPGDAAAGAAVDDDIEAQLGPTLDALAEMALQAEVTARAVRHPIPRYEVFYGREDGIVTVERAPNLRGTPHPTPQPARRRLVVEDADDPAPVPPPSPPPLADRGAPEGEGPPADSGLGLGPR